MTPPVILVVEDEPGIREALALLLGLEGFEVMAAPDAIHALEILEKNDCDLIITDLMMPRMDGLTFLARVREQDRFRATPTILISAVHRIATPTAPLADAFIGKPFEASKLLQTIGRLLPAA